MMDSQKVHFCDCEIDTNKKMIFLKKVIDPENPEFTKSIVVYLKSPRRRREQIWTRKKCMFATTTYRCVSKISSPEARKIWDSQKVHFCDCEIDTNKKMILNNKKTKKQKKGHRSRTP